MGNYTIKGASLRSVHLQEDPRTYDNTTSFSFGSPTNITPNDIGSNDRFGASISVHENRLAVGCPGKNEVHVLTYSKSTGTWTPVIKLNDPTPGFGKAVAISGNLLVVGAPDFNGGQGRIASFEVTNSGWLPTFHPYLDITNPEIESSAEFGSVLAFHGYTLLVGTPKAFGGGNTSRYGAVYPYEWLRNKKEWVNLARILPNTPQADSGFGSALGMDKETTIAIGSPRQNVNAGSTVSGAGHVDVYDRSGELGSFWIHNVAITAPTPIANGNFGTKLELLVEQLLVGSNNGNTQLLTGFKANWRQLADFDTWGGGPTLAFEPERGLIAIHGQQSIFLYQLTDAGNWLLADTISIMEFSGMAFSEGGLVVATPAVDNAGAVFVYPLLES